MTVAVLCALCALLSVDASSAGLFSTPVMALVDHLAAQAGNERGMNMLVAGVYAAISGTITLENLYTAIEHAFEGGKAKFIPGNQEMAKVGYNYGMEHFGK